MPRATPTTEKRKGPEQKIGEVMQVDGVRDELLGARLPNFAC
jgi:hypothetical protein